MAFSYSDNNFTVVGNLCFVHIPLDGTKTIFDIPPAISERMLFNNTVSAYPYITRTSNNSVTKNIGFAIISSGRIICSAAGEGYLSFYFQIDSNK